MSIEIWISAGVLLCAALVAYLLSTRNRYRSVMEKPDALKHYEDTRDEITEEQDVEPEPEEAEDEEEADDNSASNSTSSSLGGMIGIGLLIPFVLIMWFVLSSGNISSPSVSNNVSKMGDFQAVVVNDLGNVGQALVQWLDLIVLLIVMGSIVGIFVKVGGLFDGETSTEKKLRRTLRESKSKNVQHYEDMRDKITKSQLRKGKRKQKAREQ